MFGIGWVEIAMMMTVVVFFLTIFLTIFAVVMKQRSGFPVAPQQSPAEAIRPAVADPVEDSASVVARITQRFCPRCRAALAADAPEGLCPACLMAGGLADGGRNVTEGVPNGGNGVAATTPPSGSQPPTMGEWTDLARHFPQLEILELLGRGGMGAVYKARQKNLDRLVALKVIPPDAAKDPTFAERFAREARALARLNHPNIVTVYDFGQVGDVYFLLMEYVDGVNLRHAQHASRLTPGEALAVVPQICDALQYAHDQGVIHRDIKPENILLDRAGRVKIADFGLAKMLGKGPDDFTLTGTQQVMGTPRYMAPEQIEKPASVDHRADIYSLGVVIYEMLTGELPIGRFQPPSQKIQLDVRIDEVVLRALEKEPDRRYQRASHVKSELASASSWQNQQPPTWHTPAPPPHKEHATAAMPEWVNARSIAVAMIASLFMLIGGTAAILWALLSVPPSSGDFRVCIAVASLFVMGGAAAAAGGYQGYRQVAGGEDLWWSRSTTWLDFVVQLFLGIGIIWLVLAAIKFLGDKPKPDWALISLGCVTVSYAAAFLLLRWKIRTTAMTAGDSFPIISSGDLADMASAATTFLRRLSRSRNEQWVGGVCGGLGENTPIPTWCWRALFLVLIFGYGIGVIAYIVLWICLPEATGDPAPPPSAGPVSDWLRRLSCSRRNRFLGGVCGGLGEHTPIPAWCWRLGFLVLMLAYGIGVIPYVVLWICLPEAKRKPTVASTPPSDAAGTDDDRPSWHTPAPATKPYAAGSLSGWQIAIIAAFSTLVIVGMLVFVSVIFYLRLRSTQEEGATIATQTTRSHERTNVELTPEDAEQEAAAAGDFGRILKSLRAESHDDGKLSFVKLVSRENKFTSDQARQLLQSFNFDSDREKAAVVLYPSITNRKDFYLILEPFTHDTGRTALLKRLKLDGPVKSQSVWPGIAILPEESQRMMRTLNACSLDEGKLAVIKAIASERILTSDQARPLLQAFNFDTDREKASLDVYPRLNDPQNFYRVLEVFTFDSGRQAVRKKLKLD